MLSFNAFRQQFLEDIERNNTPKGTMFPYMHVPKPLGNTVDFKGERVIGKIGRHKVYHAQDNTEFASRNHHAFYTKNMFGGRATVVHTSAVPGSTEHAINGLARAAKGFRGGARAHELYHHLVTQHGIDLVGTSHSRGAQGVWHNLNQMDGVAIHKEEGHEYSGKARAPTQHGQVPKGTDFATFQTNAYHGNHTQLRATRARDLGESKHISGTKRDGMYSQDVETASSIGSIGYDHDGGDHYIMVMSKDGGYSHHNDDSGAKANSRYLYKAAQAINRFIDKKNPEALHMSASDADAVKANHKQRVYNALAQRIARQRGAKFTIHKNRYGGGNAVVWGLKKPTGA